MAIDWNSGDHSGTIKLNDGRSLYLQSSGPTRKDANTPAVILIHGMGGSYLEFIPVLKMISKFARVYLPERAGYQPCDMPTKEPTISNIVRDLRELLDITDVKPPYVLVGHSFGGPIALQWLLEFGAEDLAGMVLLDSASPSREIPDEMRSLLGEARYEDVIGITSAGIISKEEDLAIQEKMKIHCDKDGIVSREMQHKDKITELEEQIRGKQLLDSKPLSVIMGNVAGDIRKVYDYGMEHGYGDEKARTAIRQFYETEPERDEARQRGLSKLSGNGRFVKGEGKAATHSSHVTEPGVVVGEVEWVLREWEGRGGR